MTQLKEQAYRSWVEVDLDSFTWNWAELRRLVGPAVRVLQVVKADAYGHGAIEISHTALKNGAACLGVANADEGVQLRVSGITAPIIILSPSTGGEIREIIKYGLTPSLSDLLFASEFQRHLARAGVTSPVHIEIDTGMGRGGMLCEEAPAIIRNIFGLPNIAVEGIFTHLASSEVCVDYNEQQWSLFRELTDRLNAMGISIPIKHMANSGAILNYPRFHLDMVRPGLMSYGIHPAPSTEDRADLRPVMSFKTRVVLLKEFPAGASIGYNRTYVTERPSRIATLPVGYGDGYGVILSNQGEVLIRGRRAPVVGRISMDMTTVDVSAIPDCHIGDEVVLMGRQGEEVISANDIAVRVRTISYDILCALGKRAPRIFLQKGKTDAVEPRLRRIFIPHEERSRARIDGMIRQCFQVRARSEELGDAIFYEMFEALFGKDDRQLELRSNFRYEIAVSEPAGEEAPEREGDSDDFRVTTRIEYTKVFRNPVFLIGCAGNSEQLSSFFEDPLCEYRWLLQDGHFPVCDRDFRVQRVRIDSEDVPVIRTENTGRGYEVWCGGEYLREKLSRQVRVELEIVTRTARSRRFFSVYLVYPTRGLDITFCYEGTPIASVREVSFFAGRQPYPEITRETGRSIHLRIRDDEWVFPNSGVTFLWDDAGSERVKGQ
ncbi:MAG: Alanine racemase [Syntrophus sp. PtaB.Bin075]|nr:MAG: Alanine racemase [Syntrophus sp. PtaB.Bin075]